MLVDEVANFHILQKHMSIYGKIFYVPGGKGSKTPLAPKDIGTIDNKDDQFFYLTNAETQLLP